MHIATVLPDIDRVGRYEEEILMYENRQTVRQMCIKVANEGNDC